MKLVLLLTVVALACAQVYAAPFGGQVHVVNNYNPNDPTQVHVVDNDPTQVHVVDNNSHYETQVHVVDNDPTQVHVVDNNSHDDTKVHVVDNNYNGHYQGNGGFVEDSAFNRPTVNGNGGGGFVEDSAFYRPTVNGNQGGFIVDEAFGRPTAPNGGYEPIDTQPAFVEGSHGYEPIHTGPTFVDNDGRKHYNNPYLRSG